MRDPFTIKTVCDASVERKSGLGDDLALAGRYEVTCLGPDGKTRQAPTAPLPLVPSIGQR